jgi:hypothetical protein
LSSRAVAAELAEIKVARNSGSLEKSMQLFAVLVLELFLNAIRAQALHPAAHKEARLINGIAESLAGITQHDQRARLRHEGAHVADRALDHDVGALERDAASRGRAAVDHQQAAIGGGAGGLAGVALHMDQA